MSDDAVQREINAAIGVYREPGRRRNISGENGLIAKISTHAELTEANGSGVTLNAIETVLARDTVLFYGRQDVAHALLNTASLLGEVTSLRREVRVLMFAVSLLVLVIAGLVGSWVLGLRIGR